ncbi:hypothetical protein B0H21DRAFT_547020 [Amylocystis lapponica]|nr:hypothetical protein B0H21DRAFT_547020 [Amylocystis lapponica]
MDSAAALKLEIARLSGAINRHKTTEPAPRSTGYPAARPRNNVYVNPNYKPPSKTSRPPPPVHRSSQVVGGNGPSTSQTHDVVIGGVAFQSSGRSLVRKDLPKPVSSAKPVPRMIPPRANYARNNAGTLVNVNRLYKPRSSRRGGRPAARNMTLDNTRPYQSRRLSTKRAKYSDKPCPRFTTTGACNRGLTCMYQHDPAKIAICWNFLQGNCPNTAETCALSHDPTPERTPLCVHFANNGRCTRMFCPYPHVRVGAREGVCRDFAVLGYCAKGLDCEQQHVRECPDFAEKGACTTKGCKLPHVIRANRNRKPLPTATASPPMDTGVASSSTAGPSAVPAQAFADSADVSSSRAVKAEDAQLGDEFISLTFNESDSDDEDSDDEDEDDVEDDEEDLEPHEDMQDDGAAYAN